MRQPRWIHQWLAYHWWAHRDPGRLQVQTYLQIDSEQVGDLHALQEHGGGPEDAAVDLGLVGL